MNGKPVYHADGLASPVDQAQQRHGLIRVVLVPLALLLGVVCIGGWTAIDAGINKVTLAKVDLTWLKALIGALNT